MLGDAADGAEAPSTLQASGGAPPPLAGAKKSLGDPPGGPSKLVAQLTSPAQPTTTTPATTSPLPPVRSPAKPPTTSAGADSLHQASATKTPPHWASGLATPFRAFGRFAAKAILGPDGQTTGFDGRQLTFDLPPPGDDTVPPPATPAPVQCQPTAPSWVEAGTGAPSARAAGNARGEVPAVGPQGSGADSGAAVPPPAGGGAADDCGLPDKSLPTTGGVYLADGQNVTGPRGPPRTEEGGSSAGYWQSGNPLVIGGVGALGTERSGSPNRVVDSACCRKKHGQLAVLCAFTAVSACQNCVIAVRSSLPWPLLGYV
eukprot:SAG25_NODE_534_length_7139_cov_17.597443_2_plen_316_part_00